MSGKVVSFARRLLVYVSGFFIMAAAIGLSVRSGLGIFPLSLLPYTLSQLFGYKQGDFTTAIYILLVIVQIIMLRKDFKLINLFQLFISVLMGRFVNLWLAWMDFPTPDAYILRLLLCLASVAVLAFGLSVYASASLPLQPPDSLAMAISQKTGYEFHNIKMCIDVSFLVLSVAFSLIFAGKLIGVREGTVLTAFTVAKTMGLFQKLDGRLLGRFCFSPLDDANSHENSSRG